MLTFFSLLQLLLNGYFSLLDVYLSLSVFPSLFFLQHLDFLEDVVLFENTDQRVVDRVHEQYNIGKDVDYYQEGICLLVHSLSYIPYGITRHHRG